MFAFTRVLPLSVSHFVCDFTGDVDGENLKTLTYLWLNEPKNNASGYLASISGASKSESVWIA